MTNECVIYYTYQDLTSHDTIPGPLMQVPHQPATCWGTVKGGVTTTLASCSCIGLVRSMGLELLLTPLPADGYWPTVAPAIPGTLSTAEERAVP